jgi:hypothetical protein
MPRAFALRYGRGCFGVYGEMVMRLMRVKRLNGEQVQASRARVACYEHEVMEFVPGEECLCCARNWRSFPELTQSLSSLSGEGRNGLTPHHAASHLQVKSSTPNCATFVARLDSLKVYRLHYRTTEKSKFVIYKYGIGDERLVQNTARTTPRISRTLLRLTSNTTNYIQSNQSVQASLLKVFIEIYCFYLILLPHARSTVVTKNHHACFGYPGRRFP